MKEENKQKYHNILFSILLIVSCVVNHARTADEIKFFSKFSLFILFYIAFVIIYETPEYMEEKEPQYDAFIFDFKKWTASYGCYIYSFNCIVNVFMIKATLKRTSKPRIKKVFVRTLIFVIIFYLTVGFGGYLSLGRDAQLYDLVLLRPALNNS